MCKTGDNQAAQAADYHHDHGTDAVPTMNRDLPISMKGTGAHRTCRACVSVSETRHDRERLPRTDLPSLSMRRELVHFCMSCKSFVPPRCWWEVRAQGGAGPLCVIHRTTGADRGAHFQRHARFVANQTAACGLAAA